MSVLLGRRLQLSQVRQDEIAEEVGTDGSRAAATSHDRHV